jgi:signal transduction histidine kinase
VPVGKFKIGLIAQEAKPHLTNDVLHDERISNPAWARQQGMIAFAGYPLLADGRVLGVMALFAREPLFDDTLAALSSIADLVAQGIQRKRAEEELASVHAELENHARQLEQHVQERTASLNESLKALETLLYTIAHDLRAPNRAMQGYAHLLMTAHSHQLDEQGRFFLQRISEAAVKNEALIRDLLELGRLMHIEFPCTAVSPRETIDAVLRQFELEIHSAKARVDVAAKWPPVRANASALNHVFGNLISNALKFVAPNTAPDIRIYPEDAPQRGNSRLVRLCIRDNGIGIPLEQQEKVFEPFQRASNTTHEGTGMGLAIVRKAAERMGGRAGVESQPGQGSTFWIELKKA